MANYGIEYRIKRNGSQVGVVVKLENAATASNELDARRKRHFGQKAPGDYRVEAKSSFSGDNDWQLFCEFTIRPKQKK